MLDVSDQVAMSNSVTGVDQTGTLSSIRTLDLLLPGVHVEVFAQKEGVGDLHLTVRSQTGTLVDQIVVLLLWLDVDQTVLRWSSRSGSTKSGDLNNRQLQLNEPNLPSETFFKLISSKLLIRIFIATRLTLPKIK